MCRKRPHTILFGLFALLLAGGLLGCEGCEEKKAKKLSLPFSDNFNRVALGNNYSSESIGRWRISYNNQTHDGRLCVDNTRNNPLFLNLKLPRNVVVEFDAWAMENEGDVKVEIFTDGKLHATGYVLIHGGWNNRISIIDRLDEHNKNRRRRGGGPVRGRKYRWKITRHGDTVNWYIDGKFFMKYKDPKPLEGKKHGFFAFSNWKSHICFDNLRVAEFSGAQSASAAKPKKVLASAKKKKKDDDNDVEEEEDQNPKGNNRDWSKSSRSLEIKRLPLPPARRLPVIRANPGLLRLRNPRALKTPILKRPSFKVLPKHSIQELRKK